MSAHTKSTLDGLFKDVYADKFDSLIPDFGILTKKIPFAKSKKTGRDFVQSVKLTNEHGFTYGSGLATLVDIIQSDVDDAKVRGSSMTLRTGFSYDAAANMASDRGSFINATKFKFMAMMESATHRLEQQILYGGAGLAVGDSAQASTITATTDVIVPLRSDSWASGVWAGAEGAEVSLFNGAVGSTATGANGANRFELIAVDAVNQAITVRTSAGAQATILSGEVDADDHQVEWYNAKNNEMIGLRDIITNTGTLFGIDGSSYSLWSGNTYAVGAANLTLKKIFLGLNLPIGKGLMEDVCVLVSPSTFATMANDEASLVRYQGKLTKADRGPEMIMFRGPMGGVEIIPHPMQRDVEAMAFPKNKCERIGATDLTFNTPGRGDEMFKQLDNATGYECRLYSEQAIFLPCPAKGLLFTGIANT